MSASGHFFTSADTPVRLPGYRRTELKRPQEVSPATFGVARLARLGDGKHLSRARLATEATNSRPRDPAPDLRSAARRSLACAKWTHVRVLSRRARTYVLDPNLPLPFADLELRDWLRTAAGSGNTGSAALPPHAEASWANDTPQEIGVGRFFHYRRPSVQYLEFWGECVVD